MVKPIDRDRVPEPLRARRTDLQGITAHLRSLMGADCQVDFEFVESIPRAPSGKYASPCARARRADDPALADATS